MGIVKWAKSKLLKREYKQTLENDNEILEENMRLKKQNLLILQENKEIGEKLRNLQKDIKIQERKVIEKECNENISIDFFDKKIEELIIKNICKAKKELCIAVGWFTSDNIIDELEKLKMSGIRIRIIVDDNDYNNKKISNLKNASTQLKLVALGHKNHMHHKYCIIDDYKVINGSYNWTNNAKNSLENITVIEGKEIIKKFKKNFEEIINNY